MDPLTFITGRLHQKAWKPTVPGKGWFVVLRLYSPEEAWFKKTWRPGEIELVK